MLRNVFVSLILVCVLKISYGSEMDNVTDISWGFESETCYCNAGESLLIFLDKDTGVCKCRCIGHGRSSLICSPCYDNLQYCANECCFYDDEQCNSDGFCRVPGEIDFVTAAKVAVLFALVITCIAVLVALFRSFFLPRWCGARPQLVRSQSGPERRSLNSVQRFVMERMRSRPPDYEHQPEKPPSYEDCINAEEPPAYGIAIVGDVGDPPPYNAVYSETQVIESPEGVETPNNPMVLNVRALHQVAPVHQNFEEVGHSNPGFSADDGRNDGAPQIQYNL